MVVIANNCASKKQLTVISKVVNAMHKMELLLKMYDYLATVQHNIWHW